jgi:excisionase family DNA binding protein
VKVKEVAERLEVSQDTIYSLVAAGKLRCIRVGVGRGTIRVTEEHLAEFMAGATTGPKVAAQPKTKLKRYVPKFDHGLSS